MQTKVIFSCQKCGAQALKWAGRCSECNAWGTLTEEIERLRDREIKKTRTRPGKTVALGDIKAVSGKRLAVGLDEVDRVLGGGIPAGAVILLAGEPGIGKSTLVAQIAQNYALSEAQRSRKASLNQNSPSTSSGHILYVAGEESPEQLKQRFDRLLPTPYSLLPINILTNTNAETVATTIESTHPALAIVDSVQTLTANAAEGGGTITQLRASTTIVAEAAKRTGVPVVLIGQVTKSLDIAGPKSLEHLVDIVLTFEGDRYGNYRVLRAAKNRFGPTDEIGVFEMTAQGLLEVKNPSAAFLETRSRAPGSVVTCVLEGSRPILVEVQALATRSHFPYPERRASGFDLNRLNLLLAVLEKHQAPSTKSQINSKFQIPNYDIHINITGGFKVREPAADLAVLLAIASSLTEKPLPHDLLAFGEVGLGGELRPVREAARRINEAKKLGLTTFVIPRSADLPLEKGVHASTTLREAFEHTGIS